MNESNSLEDLSKEYFAELRNLVQDPQQSSVYEEYGSFQFFALRQIEVKDRSLLFRNNFFLIKDETVFSIDSASLRATPTALEDFVDRLLKAYEKNERILSAYALEIENMEFDLFEQESIQYFMRAWIGIRKDLLRIENFYLRNIMVFREFSRRNTLKLEEFVDEIKDIEEEIQLQSSLVQSLKARLDTLYNYHSSIKGDRLNKTLLLLTIISGVFLPLNLIVGFFGMNTSNLIFEGEADGTKNVLIVLIVVAALSVIGLRLVKFIDQLFLRFLLGRFNFYKGVTSRLDELDKNLRGKN